MIQGRIRRSLFKPWSKPWKMFSHAVFDKACQWLIQETPITTTVTDYEELRHELKPGDVVLVEGRSRVARIIQRLTMSRWSHAVLYIGRLDDIEGDKLKRAVIRHFDRSSSSKRNPQLIIESELGIGTVVRPLLTYKGEHLRICRPDGLAPQDRNRVLAFAASRLGQAYDIRQILDLLRLSMPAGVLSRWRSVLFQNTEILQPTPKTTCATLIAEAFSFVNFPVRPLVMQDKEKGHRLYQRNPLYCTPGDFDYSPWFQIMKFPSSETSSRGFYHKLPWQQGAHQNDKLEHAHLDGQALAKLKRSRERQLH
ncbi:hypothetical protein [Parendozoicomonas sp. Alg238-R29]|uniref:hypothetical protein n=1 Tax=Parendozoicomonas sp. Alg238-R29 TaxID=2993446 RepID=UPI00248E8C28|nr:hypothetical protein [Parendozoicomonas sp. Alg238-R29]